MDIQIACNLLDIDDLTRGNYTNLTYDYVKRKYHKMALKWHPDKNGNTVEATQRFQKINEAYTYLITELELTNDNDFVSSSFNQNQNQDTDKKEHQINDRFVS